MKKIIWCVAMCLLCAPFAAHAQQESAVRVAVMPFEVFSGEQKAALGREVAVKLLRELSAHPLILTPDVQDLEAVLSREEPATPSEERLREVSKLLNVNFLLFGSVTKVKDALSVDTQIFYNFPGENYFKTYAEGPDLDKVIQDIARKIAQELLDKAPQIPPALRPKVKTQKKPLPVAGEASSAEYEKAVDRELAADEEKQAAEQEARGHGGVIAQEELTDQELSGKAGPSKKALVAEEPENGEAPSGETKTKIRKAKGEDNESKKGGVPVKLNQPVNINADALEYNNKDNTAVFRGNVVARQSDMVMFADQMEVTYGGGAAGKGEKGGVKELTATGNVKIIQGDRIATGKKIVFYADEQKIVATGDPRVWQGDNVIVGSKITVYLKQDRSVVEGNPQDRVSATIYPKEKKGKKQ